MAIFQAVLERQRRMKISRPISLILIQKLAAMATSLK